jgi:RNA-directed DNA polymerase
MTRNSSISEKPLWHRPRRLADWLNPTGAGKVHSLVDKVYQKKNLELAWKKVKANHGAGGVDGQSIEEFEVEAERHLLRLQQELKADGYRPQPVRQKLIPKPGQPGKCRALGIPTV